MTVTIHQPTKKVTLTPKAIAHTKKWMQKEGGDALRIYVKPTGCSGYSYKADIIHSNQIDKSTCELIEQDNGVQVYVDIESLPLINGVTVDYVQEGLKASFKYLNNPQEKGACGCGESFTVKE